MPRGMGFRSAWRSPDLEERLVRKPNGGERAPVDRTRIDADAVGQIPAHVEVLARCVAVDHRHTQAVGQITGGSIPEQFPRRRTTQHGVDVVCRGLRKIEPRMNKYVLLGMVVELQAVLVLII